MNELINFKDILEKSFLKTDFFGAVNFSDIAIGLVVTLLLSLLIFFIYRETYSGVMYSHNYNVSLVLMSMITATVIMTISSNLVLSLGMVGALSIVRFRTAVKDPMDVVFMFWAIALGITTGAKLYMVAVTGSIFIAIITVLLMRYKNSNNVFLLIIHHDQEASDSLWRKLSELDYKLKSKTLSNGITELTLELKMIGSDTSFIEVIGETDGVKNVSLVSYNGNFVG